MAKNGLLTLAPGRAGALAALFGWLAVYLQLSIANLLGFSPLFALWFALGGGILAGALGALFGILAGLVLRRGIVATVVSAMVPLTAAVLALIRSWMLANAAGRGEYLLGPTVQAVALALIGGALCTGMLLATGRGTRSGAVAVVATLLIGAILSGDPAPSQILGDPSRLTVELQPTFEPPRTLVLALDGLDWKLLDDLLAADGRRPPGEKLLPSFAALVTSGSRADMETARPSVLPHVWTTLATGRPWYEHGVRDWETWKALGASRNLAIEYTAAAPFLRATSEFAPFLVERRMTAQSSARERRAFWEVLAQAGVPTAVIGWPLSHPAPAVEGAVLVSELAFSGYQPVLSDCVQPADRQELVESIRSPEAQEIYLAEARSVLRGLDFTSEAAEEALLAHLVGFQQRVAVLERLIKDRAANTYVLYDRLVAAALRSGGAAQVLDSGSPISGPLSVRLQSVVEAVVRRLLSQLRFSEGRVQVVILSGGGREDAPAGPERRAAGGGESPGVFLASGAEIARRADLGRVTLLDVAPTLLYAKGLPVAEDLSGRVLDKLFVREFREEHPLRTVATYEFPGWKQDYAIAAPDPALEQALLEELGYVVPHAQEPPPDN